MCLEDIRLGRQSYSSVSAVLVDNASATPIAKADPRRTRLFVSVNDSQSLRLSPGEVPPTATVGIGLAQGQSFILLRIEDIGPIIQGPWFARAALANTTAIVIDVSLGKE